MYEFGWVVFGLAIGFILFIITFALSLATRKPDFEIDESEEFSGLIDVKRRNKEKHDD